MSNAECHIAIDISLGTRVILKDENFSNLEYVDGTNILMQDGTFLLLVNAD